MQSACNKAYLLAHAWRGLLCCEIKAAHAASWACLIAYPVLVCMAHAAEEAACVLLRIMV